MDVYGLIGNPVGHSLSPPMHEAVYECLDMDARYVTFEPPKDAATEAVDSANTLGVAGLNVTIPFKQDVLQAVEPDELAAQIGAVNTITFGEDDTDVTGHNTDARGVIRALEHHGVSLSGRGVVVGAGGAGRAVAFALAHEGMHIDIVNRTVERAESLAADITQESLEGTAEGRGLDAAESVVPSADLLVNATSVGMEEDRSPVPASTLHGDLTVLDAVYSPIDTRLLQDAADAGALTIDGAWMLLYQGVEAFERWTDQGAPVQVMNEALRDRLD